MTMQDSTNASVIISKSGFILHIIFNRPDRLNAVNEQLYQETLGALREADSNDEIRCVIISGSGRAFCAGADLKAHQSGRRTVKDRLDYISLGQEVCAQIQYMNKPVIAQVHGYAIGGGAEIATSADFFTIADDCIISFPEVSIGTFVTGGVTARLPKLVGMRRASELLLLGERINGLKAAEIGLANISVPLNELEQTTLELANKLCSNAPLSVQKMKASLSSSSSASDVFKSEVRDIMEIMKTEDWLEGVNSFAEKRKPEFKGR